MMRRFVVTCLAAAAIAAAPATPRTFASPDAAVRALHDAVKASNVDEVFAIFGQDGQTLASASDPATARVNREVFIAAMAEGWHLVKAGETRRTLVIGNENWPFPVPIVKSGTTWRFDTKAGKEEVLARRIGRNEIATIETCRAYVSAQRRYAADAHDGKPSGLYAMMFTSAPGKHNGLYWPTTRGEKRSPLGDLVAAATGDAEGNRATGTPFQGYYFRILTAQGAHAGGGAKSYVVNGELAGGFALIAWPAQYDATGVMTFIVNQDGIIRQKDLGTDTATRAAAIAAYDPDATWHEAR
jgi:hypothetical protein